MQDGCLRFFDWEGAQREDQAKVPEEQTLNWISPNRLRNLDVPLRRTDDYHALGLTIWELFTGRIPFYGLAENEVEEKILAGDRVDITEIEQVDVRGIVEKYLTMGSQLQRS